MASRRWWTAGACAGAAWLAAGFARAEGDRREPDDVEVELDPNAPAEPPRSEPPPPKPLPAPNKPRDAEPRTGLLLRIAAGPSLITSHFVMGTGVGDPIEAVFVGAGTNLDGRIGWGFLPGMAAGFRGGALVVHCWRRDGKDGPDNDMPAAAIGMIGGFAEMHPTLLGGFHLDFSPAFAWLHLPDPSGAYREAANLRGINTSLIIGYERRVAGSWGIGVQARADWGLLFHNDPNVDGAAGTFEWISPGIQATATYF